MGRAICLLVLLMSAPASADPSPMERYRVGRVLWHYDMYDVAIPVFARLADEHRQTDLGEWAVELLLDSLIRARRFDELLARVDALLADETFLADKPDLAERLRIIQSQGRRRDAERAERAGDYGRCAEIYVSIAAAEPEAERVDEILYNAAVCAGRAGDLDRAIALRERLIDEFPKSWLAAKTWLWLAADHASKADYRAAAERLEGYAKRYAGEKDAPAALTNAIVYRRGLGDVDAAADDTEWFVKMFGKKRRDDAAQALFALAGMYRDRDGDKMAAALRRYLKTAGARGGHDRAIIAHVELGRIAWEQSCRRAERGLCRNKRSATRVKKATASFRKALALHAKHAHRRSDLPAHRAEAMRDAIAEAKLYLADTELETALRDPTVAAEDVRRAYTVVVETGSPRWSVAALSRLGQLFEARGDAANAAEQYAACLATASDAAIDGPYAALCDERAGPDLASPRERRAAPTAQPDILTRAALEQ